MSKFGTILLSAVFLSIGVFGGMTWKDFSEKNICAENGGKMENNICIKEKIIEKEKIVFKKDEKIYFCDENGNKFISAEEAKKSGLKDTEFGATYCPEYLEEKEESNRRRGF